MPDLRKSWKNTGTGLGGAFKNLGKTIINSGKKGVDKAVEWAEREDAPRQPDAAAPPAAAKTPENTQPAQPAQPAPAAKPQGAPAKSTADEIRKLAQLKNEGIITEEEFAVKKKQLLGL